MSAREPCSAVVRVVPLVRSIVLVFMLLLLTSPTCQEGGNQLHRRSTRVLRPVYSSRKSGIYQSAPSSLINSANTSFTSSINPNHSSTTPDYDYANWLYYQNFQTRTTPSVTSFHGGASENSSLASTTISKRVETMLRPPGEYTAPQTHAGSGIQHVEHVNSYSSPSSFYEPVQSYQPPDPSHTNDVASYGYVSMYEEPHYHHEPEHHHHHKEEEEELVEIEDKVFSKTLVATKALKIGKCIFVIAMFLVVLVLAALGKAGVSLSPAVLPLALFPIGFIALLLFVPLFLLFIPLVATGVAGGKKRRRRSTTSQTQSSSTGFSPEVDIDQILAVESGLQQIVDKLSAHMDWLDIK